MTWARRMAIVYRSEIKKIARSQLHILLYTTNVLAKCKGMSLEQYRLLLLEKTEAEKL